MMFDQVVTVNSPQSAIYFPSLLYVDQDMLDFQTRTLKTSGDFFS